MKRIALILLLVSFAYPQNRAVKSFILKYGNASNATVLNGTNQYWQNASPDSFTLGGHQVLMMAWVRTNTTSGTQVIVGKYKSAAAGRSMLIIVENAGSPWVYVSGDGNGNANRAANFTVSVNRWVHVAATYTPSALNIYVNGVLSNGTLTGSIPSALFNPVGTPLAVGVNGALNTAYFNGLIGEVQVVRFTTLPDNIANSIYTAYANDKFPTSYDGGEVIFHTRWQSGGRDMSPKNNTVTKVNDPIIVKVKQ